MKLHVNCINCDYRLYMWFAIILFVDKCRIQLNSNCITAFDKLKIALQVAHSKYSKFIYYYTHNA